VYGGGCIMMHVLFFLLLTLRIALAVSHSAQRIRGSQQRRCKDCLYCVRSRPNVLHASISFTSVHFKLVFVAFILLKTEPVRPRFCHPYTLASTTQGH
jgi:hypothetical protein